MTRTIFSKICVATLILSIASSNAHAQESVVAKISNALSGHHDKTTAKELETIAGSEDNLVNALLTLRTTDKPPYVAIRSEKLLLNYANRADVSTALQSDIQDKNLRGLAGAIALHIDQIQDPVVRRNLAQLAVSRAKQDSEYKNFTTGFSNSNDPEVRKIFVGN